MMTRKSWAIGIAVVVVAFGVGWLGAKLTDLNKVPMADVFARQWNYDVGMLIQNRQTLKFNDPSKVPARIGADLNTSSIQLARNYDNLSPFWKKQVVFDLPEARVIAQAGGNSSLQYRGAVNILIDCVQQVQAHGGSVHKCASAKKIWARSGVNYALLPIHLTSGPPHPLPSASTSR